MTSSIVQSLCNSWASCQQWLIAHASWFHAKIHIKRPIKAANYCWLATPSEPWRGIRCAWALHVITTYCYITEQNTHVSDSSRHADFWDAATACINSPNKQCLIAHKFTRNLSVIATSDKQFGIASKGLTFQDTWYRMQLDFPAK